MIIIGIDCATDPKKMGITRAVSSPHELKVLIFGGVPKGRVTG
ncbi:hypothetical protein [Aestuariirhabdus sp. LZHN29]